MEFEQKLLSSDGVLLRFPSPCGVMEFEHLEGISIMHENYLFPSPCGVMEFEHGVDIDNIGSEMFPSPCGVMEFEPVQVSDIEDAPASCFRPLAG